VHDELTKLARLAVLSKPLGKKDKATSGQRRRKKQDREL